jgi:hypothetical protein
MIIRVNEKDGGKKLQFLLNFKLTHPDHQK